MICSGKCDICEKSGCVYKVCECKQTHAKCFQKGECVLCKEKFYLPTWMDLFFIAIVVITGFGSILVQHM